MKVSELIAELQKVPQDKVVIMFDGPTYKTPFRVEETDKYDNKEYVIID